jgi:phenylacetate-CoA ligase
MFTNGLKSIVSRFPARLHRRLNWRLRKLTFAPTVYRLNRRWTTFTRMGEDERRQWLLGEVRAIACYAQKNNPFYREFYRQQGFDAHALTAFEELASIPVVSKDLLRDAGPDWRQPGGRSALENTGGTSGNPLQFCTGRHIWVKEDFHIDKIWRRIGCSRRHSRAVFRGVNLGRAPWVYRPGDDAFYINTYRSYSETAHDLHRLFVGRKIEFLHGYPSAIYQFALHCLEEKFVDLRRAVTRSLRGVLLGSEYPAPQYRTVIEETFQVRTLSWYGHSEKAVLAGETYQQGVYEPLQTYGYAEAVENAAGSYSLVGTSFDNPWSPFIRYDTGDSIEPVEQDRGLLLSFRIASGRVGEFVLDRNGTPISLTALVFGRHHKGFDRAEFIQISQNQPGAATFHVTVRNSRTSAELAEWFDTRDVAIDFTFESRKRPWRTPQGKVALLIPSGVGE